MNFFKKIFPENLKKKIKVTLGTPSLLWSLRNLMDNNFLPNVILDIGAYKGDWTTETLKIYPLAKVLMIEAQKGKELYLKKIVKKNPNVNYFISLLSSKDNTEMLFCENETSSQIISKELPGQLQYKLQTQTLDNLLKANNYPYPDLLKLDVQGHELEVLRGAKESLNNAEVCLLEVSLLDLGDNPPLLMEVLNFMDQQNFQAYDISQFMRRPIDKALFQMDMFFVKKNSQLVASKSWS